MLSSVCYIFFESFFEKFFVVVSIGAFVFGGAPGFCSIWLGLFPAVFVFRPPSFACAGVYVRVGVIAWVRVCLLVTGAAGGVAGFTLVWLALGCGVCIMKGARFKGKPRQRGGGRVRGRRPRET